MEYELLIFGASGSVGEQCIRVALEKNIPVTGVYRSFEQADMAPRGTQTVVLTEMSLETLLPLLQTITETTTVISCLGARNACDAMLVDGKANATIVQAIEESERNLQRFVLLSGACVETPKIPLQFAKIHSEEVCKTLSRVPYSIIRATCFYKCFDNMIQKASQGKRIKIIGTGNYADFYPLSSNDMGKYIVNHVVACNQTYDKGSHVFSLGGSTPYTAHSFATKVQEIMAKKDIHCKISSTPVWLWRSISWVCKLIKWSKVHSFMDLVYYYNTVPMVPEIMVDETSVESYVHDLLSEEASV